MNVGVCPAAKKDGWCVVEGLVRLATLPVLDPILDGIDDDDEDEGQEGEERSEPAKDGCD